MLKHTYTDFSLRKCGQEINHSIANTKTMLL